MTYAPQGATLTGEAYFERPVCQGQSAAAQAINAEYDKLEAAFVHALEKHDPVSEFWASGGDDMPYSVNGQFFWDQVDCQCTYEENGVISFVSTEEWFFTMGVHPWHTTTCRTFDVQSGKLLRLDDVLMVDEDNVADVLWQAYLALHDDPTFARTARQWEQQLRDASTLDTQFFLADGGIHVRYGEETIYHAMGEIDVLIPYTRTDLVRAPFAQAQ